MTTDVPSPSLSNPTGFAETQAIATSTAPSRASSARKSSPQAGILNRPPEHLLLCAIELVGGDPRATVEAVRGILKDELQSVLPVDVAPELPPAETGELGFEPHHDRAHLTITVGLSSTAFDKLGVAPGNRPADLVPIPWAQLGDQPEVSESGDLLLQICADNAYVIEHVLRRIEHGLPGQVGVVWAHTGAHRYTSRPGRTARREGRGWPGFLDGTSNLNPSKSEADRALVFVNPDDAGSYPALPSPGQPSPYGGAAGPIFPQDLRAFVGAEPAWTREGTYLVARTSTLKLPEWDNTSLTAQEAAVGRRKRSGASLDLPDGATAEDEPAFATNQSDERAAIDSHIRKSNPRGGADYLNRRIFRRGYPLYEGGAALRRGLIFLAYGRTLSTQFEFISRAWLTNPNFPRPDAGVDRLRQFDGSVLAGGYYFVPPLADARTPWSWVVPGQ